MVICNYLNDVYLNVCLDGSENRKTIGRPRFSCKFMHCFFAECNKKQIDFVFPSF